MNLKLRAQAIKLRLEEELSYLEIKKKLGVSKSTLSYWLRDYPLSEEKILELRRKGWSKGEASRERYRNTIQEKREAQSQQVYKQEKRRLQNLSEQSAFVSGLMLYLGEGDKKNRNRIGLANTDPDVIQFFVKWLVEFLEIKHSEIRAQLHLYENLDIPKEKQFWQKTLRLPDKQFYKDQIRPLRSSSFSYRESNRHGTCSIFVPSTEKKTRLMMAMKALLDTYQEKKYMRV